MSKKIAVVTGSRRGIGLGIAVALAKAGYRVVVSGTRPEGDEALLAISRAGGQAEYFRCDVSRAEDRAALIGHVENAWGRLDLLVNNAGIAPLVRGDLLDVREESLDRLLAVNLKGAFFLCQLAAQSMIAALNRKTADYAPRIVNIGSISAYTSSVNRAEYCLSKAGVSMVTKLFADRLAEYGIGVFEVRPGIIRTDMTAGVTEKYEGLIAQGITPIRRMGTPEDVAGCVLAAASGLLDFATGTVLNADGGFHIRRL